MMVNARLKKKRMKMKKIYNWMILQSTKPGAVWIMSLLSFAESSISPIPPDPLLIPMVIARREKAWFYAFMCTLTSVLGGAVGYAIGFYFFQAFGQQILDFYDLNNAFMKLSIWLNKWGFWVIVIKGLTPIPYKVVTITCGAVKLNPWLFMGASMLSRGMRFYLETFIVWKYGAAMHNFLQKYVTIISIIFVAVLALGVYLLKYFA